MFNKNKLILASVLILFCFSSSFAGDSDSLKQEIYSKLKCCPCQESFEKCVCPEAREMKTYIDALLEAGVAKNDIFYRVAKKFSPKVILDEQIKSEVEQRLIKETGGKRSQIIFEPSFSDFGKVSKKQAKASKIFKLYNKGNADLIINNVRASCGCVSASLRVGKNKSPYLGVAGANPGWQVVIEPGKFGELEVVLDLNHSSMGKGKQIRDVFVSNNDPLNPEASLKVEIEVIE